jgi:hypothetical protein
MPALTRRRSDNPRRYYLSEMPARLDGGLILTNDLT